ncbi:thiamine pyrophosphate-binding protein [Antarcticirhabdus aurantiaca]|uniref:thiamine pyrophosphate-binding protein n=1 Tax=Antarcticirhabdus aurantiaca TaxID=2606717 RepID=UPI00131B5AB6|nr:thiamine pyrophosphate-binding protein [Antarcticirhabdus aurantiaca]
MDTRDPGSRRIDRPVETEIASHYGSDAIAQMLRALKVRYVALNPGASFRGVHDSLVNYLGNDDPSMLLCLHEENAVAIAHGYAKVAGEPIAVFLHSNVGLMHGAMAIFNAWCDRVPMLIFGATGPVDAAARRPWIDWIHTTTDQAALVRPYVKWDNQPASVPAAMEAMIRADIMARTEPCGPTYVTFDTQLQEAPLAAAPQLPDPARYRRPEKAGPSAAMVEAALAMIARAKAPVILAGRVSRSTEDWARRIAFAEALGAGVVTDQKVGAAFPTDHPLHRGAPRFFLGDEGAEALCAADLVISLDWLDLAGTLRLAGRVDAAVLNISLDHLLHGGWNMEHQALPAVDLHLPVDPDLAVQAFCEALAIEPAPLPADSPVCPAAPPASSDAALDMTTLASALGQGLKGECVSFVRLPLGWASENWHFRHPLDFLGYDGGAGIGSGPGMLVGAALALRDSERLAVGVLGDGDFMMANSAIWTGVHYGIPFIAVVANNRSFFNDEVHQERVAVMRERPVENKWVGQRIAEPDIDIAAIARAQGAVGIGPVTKVGELQEAVRRAVSLARQGSSVVIDARIVPGYSKAMAAGLVREAD